MTAIAYNLITSPFAGLGAKFMTHCEIIGYARAAAHLANHGMYEEAKQCMLQIQKLKK
jgi:hypothetical protein